MKRLHFKAKASLAVPTCEHEPQTSGINADFARRFIASLSLLAIASCSILAVGGVPVDEAGDYAGCFYGVTVGPDGAPVKPCSKDDPDQVAENHWVRDAMAQLSLDPALVAFQGCENGQFRAESRFADGKQVYLIRYSTSADAILAPVIHELAHVAQMEATGGFEALRAQAEGDSRRIELGADYIAGVVFAQIIAESGEIRANDFQNDLNLIGLYYEAAQNAHGTPEERTAAFRYGLKDGRDGIELSGIHQYFQDEVYGQIQQF